MRPEVYRDFLLRPRHGSFSLPNHYLSGIALFCFKGLLVLRDSKLKRGSLKTRQQKRK